MGHYWSLDVFYIPVQKADVSSSMSFIFMDVDQYDQMDRGGNDCTVKIVINAILEWF